MEPIVYIPHLKKTMQLSAKLTFCAVVLWMFIARTDSLPFFLALGALLALGVYYLLVSYRFMTFLVLDWNGIHVMHTKRGELLCVPWSQIKRCKFYPGVYDSPSVCVLFQSLNYCVDGQFLFSLEKPIDMKREGKKILCDQVLRQLSRSQISPDAFNRLEIIGITATAEQFERIKAWMDHKPENC